jgi:hypothetical protein
MEQAMILKEPAHDYRRIHLEKQKNTMQDLSQYSRQPAGDSNRLFPNTSLEGYCYNNLFSNCDLWNANTNTAETYYFTTYCLVLRLFNNHSWTGVVVTSTDVKEGL